MIHGNIQLTLMMGPIVPLPAPRVVVEALQSVTVTHSAGSSSGFQMQFSFSSTSELNTLFLIAPALNSSVATPPLRILLIITLKGM
ncbi:MAG TPA: hypothetical protein VKN35_13105, partial [Xanthomonadales bacterium]|nr:hypothetical protein [Xanthomonadales bacterium]